MRHMRTTDSAKGRWKAILVHLGLPESALTGRHGPCPICGGKDRFRWDDKDGRGTFFCSSCGPGDGMTLALRFTGRSFRDLAAEIDRLLGNLPVNAAPESPRPAKTDTERLMKNVWQASVPITRGDLADIYLATRGLRQESYTDRLRFAPRLSDGQGVFRPALVAVVSQPGGARAGTLLRIFLKDDGSSKAEDCPCKLLPGSFPIGGAIKVSDWHDGPLGVAEGLETAMSASRLFGLPVWAAVNAVNLAKWQPPEGCNDIIIFADNDRNGVGQRAADRLEERLRGLGKTVEIRLPSVVGWDWNDVLLKGAAAVPAAGPTIDTG